MLYIEISVDNENDDDDDCNNSYDGGAQKTDGEKRAPIS